MKTIGGRVLCLNKLWVPQQILSVEDAITMAWLRRATILDDAYQMHDFHSWVSRCRDHGFIEMAKSKGKPIVHSVQFSIVAPEVIVSRSVHAKFKPTKATPINVAIRDSFTCQYCGKTFPLTQLSRDHIFPESRGGKLEWSNLVAACKTCNRKKKDKTPEEAGLRLLQTPRPAPHWLAEHLRNCPELWLEVLGEQARKVQ